MSNEWKIDVDGVTKDFDTDFGFKVKSWPGTGHSPVANRATPYALQDGAFFTGQRMTARTFTLLGTFYGSTTLAAFHTQRQALIKALSSRTTTINNRPATVTITYTGAAVDKEIYVVYEGGLELATFENNIENDVPIRLTAYDPSWKATSDTVTALATSGSFTAGYFAYFIDGVWGSAAAARDNTVFALATAPNGDVYAGGNFTGKLTKWDGSTWTALGTSANNAVYAMVVAANGDLYAGGLFTTIGGVSANRVAKWDGATWTALGTGANNTVYGLAIGINGDLYAGGTFTTAGGVAASKIAKWDGSVWTALGTGANNTVWAVDVDINGDLYAGGLFSTIGGVSANRVAKWDGSTWTALGTGLGAQCLSVSCSLDGNVYAAGSFSGYLSRWDGDSWQVVGTGISGGSGAVSVLSNTTGGVLVGGDFLTAGGKSSPYFARWDGDSFVELTITPPNIVRAITTAEDDIFVGGDFTGSFPTEGVTTSAYAGTEITYPFITIKRAGGTSASVVSLVNTLTGATLNFDYDLLDGETLTIDLRPGQRTVTSSFYGLRWNAILDNSDFASWFLQPDNTAGTTDNIITAYVTTTGSPTITTNMTYRTAYRSLD